MVVQDAKTKIGDVTAIAAVCVAGVLAVTNLLGAVLLVRAFFDDPDRLDDSLTLFTTIGALLAAAAFGSGGVLLARRDETGRWIVIVAAGTQVALGVLGLLATAVNYDPEYGIHWFADKPVSEWLPIGLGGVPGAVTAIVIHNWQAALIVVLLSGLALATAAVRPTADYTLAATEPGVGSTV
ncbi:hypothetical protein [Nocardia asteroides]|uniref:hypothetical protein n=1 Tax=Nocardia asteroides TaxID=1824 RepID=UPI0034387AF0